MSLNADQVMALADLTCIDITQAEAERLADELSATIERFSAVQKAVKEKKAQEVAEEAESSETNYSSFPKGSFRQDIPGTVLDISHLLPESNMFRVGTISGKDALSGRDNAF